MVYVFKRILLFLCGIIGSFGSEFCCRVKRCDIMVSHSRAHNLYCTVSAGVTREISAQPPMQPLTESERLWIRVWWSSCLMLCTHAPSSLRHGGGNVQNVYLGKSHATCLRELKISLVLFFSEKKGKGDYFYIFNNYSPKAKWILYT